MPSVERAILGRFQKGKRPHRQLATCIFQNDLERSRSMLMEAGFFDIPFDMICRTLMRSKQDISMQDVRSCVLAIRNGKVKFNMNHLRQVLDNDNVNLHMLLENPTALMDQLEQSTPIGVPVLEEKHLPRWRPKFYMRQLQRQQQEVPVLPPQEHATWLYTLLFRIDAASLLYRAYAKAAGRDAGLKFKIITFVERHLQCVTYVDRLLDSGPPLDDDIDSFTLCDAYVPLEKSHHEEDNYLIDTEEVVHQRRQHPLDIISTAYPDKHWTIEEVIASDTALANADLSKLKVKGWQPIEYKNALPLSKYSVYWACMYILNQLDTCMDACDLNSPESKDGPIYDALFIYYACFLDLFYYGLEKGMSDEALYSFLHQNDQDGITFMEYYYPYDNRAFSAHDLPNLYHILATIPLWGEQVVPDDGSMIGKIIQKSCPFACQRRQLIVSTATAIRKDYSFWIVFSRVFWLMLSGLYPGALRTSKETRPSFRRLLRCMQLTHPVHGKELLISVITKKSTKSSVASSDGTGSDGGPLIVFLAFRLYILYMSSFHSVYLEKANECIDWIAFQQETIKMAELVRSSNIYPQDAFAVARALLCRNTKNSKNKVYRYRKYSCIVTMHETTTKVLEKKLFRELQEWQRDLTKVQDLIRDLKKPETNHNEIIRQFKDTFVSTFYTNELAKRKQKINPSNLLYLLGNAEKMSAGVVERLDVDIPQHIRSNILNFLLRIPEHKRLHIITMCVLTEQPYGGISTESVANMIRMIHVYQKTGMPKDYEKHMRKFSTYDFKIICWFWNVLAILENIKLVKLDAATVKRIDYAMANRRFVLYPGQTMTPYAYDVFITLCCNQIKTLQGQNSYGHNDIAYNLDSKMFVCSKGEKSSATSVSTAAAAAAISNVDEGEALRRIEAMSGDIMDTNALANEGDDRKRVRNQRKEFNQISCGNGQPALQINMRGYMLLYGNVINKRVAYMHCPECGAWHERKSEYFLASPNGLYMCYECLQKDPMFGRRHRECAYCGKTTQAQLSDKFALTVMCPLVDPSSGKRKTSFDPIQHMENVYQRLFFCKRHYAIAKKYAWGVPKELLWKRIQETESKKNIRQAQNVYRGSRKY